MRPAIRHQPHINRPKTASSIYESVILNFWVGFFYIINSRINKLLKKSYLVSFIGKLSWTNILIFSFILFLSMAPASQLEISQFSLNNIQTNVLNRQSFGVVIFSPANILIFLLLFMVLYQYKKRGKFIKFFPPEIILILFIVACEMSISYSISPASSLIWFIKLMFGILIYFVFSRLPLDRKTIMIIVDAFLFTVFFEFALAFAQFYNGGLLGISLAESFGRIISQQALYQNNGIQIFRALGTLSHPNLLSAYLALLAPFCFIRVLSSQKILSFGKYAVGILLLTVLTTLSRWGLITIFFSLFLTFGMVIKIKKIKFLQVYKAFRIYVILIPIFIIVISNPSITGRFSTFSQNDASLYTRINLINQALYVIGAGPFGTGAGTSIYYFANYSNTQSDQFSPLNGPLRAGGTTSTVYPVHEFYLLTLMETGAAGLLFMLYFMAQVIKQFLNRIKRINRNYQIVTIALFSSVITFFFSGLWEPRTFVDRVGFLFFLMLGLFVNILYRTEDISSNKLPPV